MQGKTDCMLHDQSCCVGSSLPLALGKHVLAVAADQLPTACRAAFAIAAPVVIVSQLCAAVTATRICGFAFKEIAPGTSRNTLVDLPTNVDICNGAALAFQHVLPA